MDLTRLYEVDKYGQMLVAGMMSGSGTNLRKSIEYERKLGEGGKSPYRVALIFSDNADSNAAQIGRDFDVPVMIRDIESFYRARGKPRSDMKLREEFDALTAKELGNHQIACAAYAGYMSKVTSPLISKFLGVNVHPADLRALTPEGRRRYTGDRAVEKALLAGEKELRSTVHTVTWKVDYGPILAISNALQVQLPQNWNPKDSGLVQMVSREHQDRLKEAGDWKIFPWVLRNIAEGRYARDFAGNIYFDGRLIPNGIMPGVEDAEK